LKTDVKIFVKFWPTKRSSYCRKAIQNSFSSANEYCLLALYYALFNSLSVCLSGTRVVIAYDRSSVNHALVICFQQCLLIS